MLEAETCVSGLQWAGLRLRSSAAAGGLSAVLQRSTGLRLPGPERLRLNGGAAELLAWALRRNLTTRNLGQNRLTMNTIASLKLELLISSLLPVAIKCLEPSNSGEAQHFQLPSPCIHSSVRMGTGRKRCVPYYCTYLNALPPHCENEQRAVRSPARVGTADGGHPGQCAVSAATRDDHFEQQQCRHWQRAGRCHAAAGAAAGAGAAAVGGARQPRACLAAVKAARRERGREQQQQQQQRFARGEPAAAAAAQTAQGAELIVGQAHVDVGGKHAH